MTIRKSVSVINNRWHDAQRVDEADQDVEQNRNISSDAAIIQNHFGSGVVLAAPTQPVLFDSDDLTAAQASIVAAGDFDGQGIDAHEQPSDINLGNQLEIELTDSNAIGRLGVKLAIIGLSFDDELIMDRFYFYRNEKQVTANHYKRIITLFFYDFKGNNNCSRNLGGRIVIKEASSFQLSRDPIMIAQDVEPDLWWRDFKKYDSQTSLENIIQAGLGSEFSVDALDINITGNADKELEADDVVSKVGQKFIAKTDNIQKITLLLGVRKDTTADEDDYYDWTGDLVISIYPLQTTTNCPTDIIPDLAIEFDPSNQPLAQLSYNQSTLRDIGVVLNDVLQPVDFVFNATKLGSASTSNIIVDNYYAIVVNRAGANTAGTIFVGVGSDKLDKARAIVYNNVWVDLPDEDLWFQVWTDGAKIADGQGYDEGNGMEYEKTITDTSTGSIIDNQIKNLSFSNTGEGTLNIGILQAIEEESVTVQDERSGNNVFSRKKFVPNFSFITESGLTDLRDVSDPLIIGAAVDKNSKQNSTLDKTQTYPGLASGDQFCIINPDADLLSLNLVGSKLIPNTECANEDFRIFDVTYCTDGYGDVNSDGYIDALDIARASELIGESLYYSSTQQKIVDGDITTLELLRADVDNDGYISSDDVDLITQFVNREINSFPAGTSFTHLCLTVQNSIGRADGYYDCSDGYVRIDGYTGLNIVQSSSLSSDALEYDGYISSPMIELDSVFTTVPFEDVPYRIIHQPFWQPYFLGFSSDAREVAVTFSAESALISASCESASSFACESRPQINPECDPGRNDSYVPDNLIIGRGQIIRPDGSPVPIDLEIVTIILQLPEEPFSELNLNIFEKLLLDRGDGFTSAGFNAARYSDCTTVQAEDLLLNRIRLSVSLQAIVTNIDGYDADDGYGIIVSDPVAGIYVDQVNGILTLTMQDLAVDEVFQTLVTKIQIQAFLKKAGWKNSVITIEPTQAVGLFST